MPRFMPVQCHKCSVLQMKPVQKLGLKWYCSMCRKPELKAVTSSPPPPAAAAAAAAATGAPGSASRGHGHEVVSDVRLFVEEVNLQSQEEMAEEMGAVANTFRGVDSLVRDGASNWEGLYYQSSKVQQQAIKWNRVNPIQVYEDDFTEEEGISNTRKRGGFQQKQLLSSLWGRWHQKAAKKDVVELMEFARCLGNEENVPPPPRS